MNKLTSRISLLFVLLALALPGCGDDDAPVVPDGGHEGDGSVDGDAGDTTPPTVIATTPADGATRVPTDSTIRIAFSEPMTITTGSVGAATDDGAVSLGDPSWNETRTTVTYTPPGGLPAGATITLTVGSTFRDVAGNALSPSYTFEISTEDTEAPTIVRTTPAEGATGVDPALAAIEVEMSEPMRVALGRARLEGPGEPALGAITWTDRVARWSVSGLAAESSYELVLEGFEDAAGNPLDTSALGSDGRLDFTTGADVTSPRVVDSTPREGQLDVDVGLISQVAITFSEPMDEAAGTFTLDVGGETTTLEPRWDRGGRRALLDVSGRLASAAAHRVVLAGLTDRAGNTLDGAAYLIDGALDFTTGSDLFVPFVAFTSPEEGATAAEAALEIVVVFSEAMDPSIDSAALTGDGRTVTLRGVWSSGDTVLTLSAPTLQAGRSYSLDLRGFRDAGGTLVDATHAYLGDSIAEFTLRAPNGERCGDALTELQATSSTAARTQWVIASGAVTEGDGSASCDPDGHGPDVLVRYRKTTPAARDGGSALHVSVVGAGSSTTRFDVDIVANDCRTTASVVEASRLRCLVERQIWDQWIDVGPGDYYVWVARDGSSVFNGATITIDEVPAVREGESCDAPLAPGSSNTVYTAPAAAGQPHRWTLPAAFGQALDRGVTHDDPAAALSCMPAGSSLGRDAVISFDKSTATSLVTVRVSMPAVSARHGAVEIARGCDPRDPSHTELACLPYSGSAIEVERTFAGPPGPISTWIVERRSAPLPGGSWNDAPAATVEITEFEPQPGDSCATAIPITPGMTNTVSANRPWRANVPACLSTGGVTWFRYTPTQGLGVLRTNGSAAGAVVDRATGSRIRCAPGDDTGAGMPVFGVPGEEVCVALSSTAGVTQITIEEMPYSGIRGIETLVPIQRSSDLPITPTLGGTGWYARQGDRILAGRGGDLFHAPRTGGDYNVSSISPLNCRYAGISRPDGVHCLDSNIGVASPRLYRVTDAAGVVLAAPVAIDAPVAGSAEYVAQRMDGLAFDGTSFLFGTNGSLSGTTPVASFYSVPAAGGPPTLLGSNNHIHDVRSLAADADYLYVYGRSGTEEAIYRLVRDDLADPNQVPHVVVTGYDLPSDGGHVHVDSTVAAGALYFRPVGSSAGGAHVYVVVDPRGDAARWVGALWRTTGVRPDWGLGLDPSGPSLWLVDTNPTTFGVWYRLD